MSHPSPTAIIIPLTVPVEQAGKRLDVFLASQLPDYSRTQIQKLIQKGCVKPLSPSKTLKSSLAILQGQSFSVSIPPAEKTDLPAQALDLDIVFEDEDVLVINKPVGLVVHPGAGNPDKTLVNALVAHCPDIAGVGGVLRPGLVHRLDKDTSGLMVAAKSDLAYRSLVRQLRERKLNRQYLALVEGFLSGKGTVNAPIGRNAGARNKMAVRSAGGKKAVTHFISLQTKQEASFLLLKLETGRTHQIRAHLSYIKHPILGDRVYGGKTDLAERPLLHSFRISFDHPGKKKKMAYWVKPPLDFADNLRKIGFRIPSWEKVQWK
jgi:23S rRNA pseudouridine1911/1915/1917 synthase